jgi:hypothetical protein
MRTTIRASPQWVTTAAAVAITLAATELDERLPATSRVLGIARAGDVVASPNTFTRGELG